MHICCDILNDIDIVWLRSISVMVCVVYKSVYWAVTGLNLKRITRLVTKHRVQLLASVLGTLNPVQIVRMK